MYSILFCLLFFFNESIINCFNFDTNYPTVYDDPDNTSANYFGYTVVMYPVTTTNPAAWVKIGAPKGNNPAEPSYRYPGLVYHCPWMNTCTPVKIPKSSADRSEKWNNNWIGGTMDISNKYDRMAICGFRRYYYIYGDNRMMGACYWSVLNETSFYSISLLRDLNRDVATVYDQTFYYFGQGQAGFSAHFPKKENELIIGAPGVFNWAGSPFKITDNTKSNTPDANRRRREIGAFKNIEHPNVLSNEAFDLLSYSVTSGYFRGNKTLYYAAGSPKGSSYKGKINIFLFNGSEKMIIKETKVGEQFGEYFGASMAAGMINDDNYEDLLVGAPFHKVNGYNEGRVYVFLGGARDLHKSAVINGESAHGQFGAAITFLGDIDHDGYGDFAVGAPYENEHSGAVYIFRGNKHGVISTPCQKILGSDVASEIRGFGISISSPADIDGNGYKDIAVGAHLSGNVVLFRSLPIIVILYNFRSIQKTLTSKSDSFVLEVCFSYREYRDGPVEIKYNINLDKSLKRAKILGRSQFERILTVQNGGNKCENVNASVKILDEDAMPITASLSYEVLNSTNCDFTSLSNNNTRPKSIIHIGKSVDKNDELDIRCPVFDKYRSNVTDYELKVTITRDCGSDFICDSELNVEISAPSLRDKDTFVVGSSNYLTLQISVENYGENAYSTKIEVTLPEDISLSPTVTNCRTQKNTPTVICDVANNLEMGKKRQIDLDLDMANINMDYNQNEIDISVRVTTSSNNANSDTFHYILKLKREAYITINGLSEQQSNYFGNDSSGVPLFSHIYKIEKFGVSPLERIRAHINIPHTLVTSDGNITFLKVFQPVATFSGQPIICKSEIEFSVEEKTFEALEITQTEDMENTKDSRRRKRQVEVFKNVSKDNMKNDIKVDDKEIEIISNRTVFLNCSMAEIVCSSVICTIGPFDSKHTLADIELKMLLNISTILGSVKTKDMILITTNGKVTVESPKIIHQNENRQDYEDISSLFLNGIIKRAQIALWIIIVALLAGILLFILLTILFVKMGFFKRTKKEELENMRAEAEEQDKMQQQESGEELEDPFRTTVNSQEDLCEEIVD